MDARTSITHPLRIDSLSCGPYSRGEIGLTFCPGRWDRVREHLPPWERDLKVDLDAISEWGAHMALTLLEAPEFELLQVPALGEAFRGRGIDWRHMPIPDLNAPGDEFLNLFKTDGTAAIEVLRRGGRVLVHCRAGLGRTGTVASMLLIELGASVEDALRRVRGARRGAVQTPSQLEFVSHYRPILGKTG